MSRGLGWPAGTTGTLVTDGPDHGPLFHRDATEAEVARATALADEDSEFLAMVGLVPLSDDPTSGAVTVPGGGAFVVAFEDATYVVDPAIEAVVRETTLESILDVDTGVLSKLVSTCDSEAGVCAIDVIMAVPHCTLATVGCGLTGVGALGCFVLLLSLCAPDLALIGLSGACTYVATNCLDGPVDSSTTTL